MPNLSDRMQEAEFYRLYAMFMDQLNKKLVPEIQKSIKKDHIMGLPLFQMNANSGRIDFGITHKKNKDSMVFSVYSSVLVDKKTKSMMIKLDLYGPVDQGLNRLMDHMLINPKEIKIENVIKWIKSVFLKRYKYYFFS